MRFVDRFVGVPLCVVAGMTIPKANGLPPKLNRVLAIKFFGLGSIALLTPALASIKGSNPGVAITFLSFTRNEEFLERIPIIDNIITINSGSPRLFLSSTLKAIRALRRTGFDATFDFEFFSKFSTLLSALSGAPVRAAFSLPTRWRRGIVTHSVEIDKRRHVSENFNALVAEVVSMQDSSPRFVPPRITEADRARVSVLVPTGIGKIVVVNPNAGDTFLERRWPSERFAKVITDLLRRPETLVAVIGTVKEREYVANLLQAIPPNPNCINLAGELTLGELSALILRAQLILSNDSGPGHIAGLLGRPLLSLFGPESPAFYGPLGNSVQVVYKAVACSPCMNVYAAKTFKCPYDAHCMKEISVEEVLGAIERMLGIPA